MVPFRQVFIELCGACNAQCPFCLCGRYKDHRPRVISPETFRAILGVLCGRRLIDPSSVVGLYNWGEPFLHPAIGDLLAIANEHRLGYGLSTNASVRPAIDGAFVRGLRSMTFSMPGFSQASYERIHKFDFEEIREHIEAIVVQCREAGYRGDFRISFHIYQFNMDEIRPCAEFARRLGVSFVPQLAILNHWDHLWNWVNGSMEGSMLREVSETLLCYAIRPLLSQAPPDYRCPQYDMLVIDEEASVQLCCQVPATPRYLAGNLLTDDVGQILERRENNEVCRDCLRRGMAYYLNHSLAPPAVLQAAAEPTAGTRGPAVWRRCISRVRQIAQRAGG